uniref:ATP synthase subunit a n=1 Tax=Polyacanthorhynchus caballeroi TaxID=178082 RepID=A0A140DJ74_9BILA|nr:ATP synthase F0 subunit 6 [Polyacanthorhynchus caballeroi]AMK47828.1 ATP synthase F0 subunit 6 [Polyacanthorhynchus caballeroi]
MFDGGAFDGGFCSGYFGFIGLVVGVSWWKGSFGKGCFLVWGVLMGLSVLVVCMVLVEMVGGMKVVFSMVVGYLGSSLELMWMGVLVVSFIGVNLSGLWVGESFTMVMGGMLMISLFLWGLSVMMFCENCGVVGVLSHLVPWGVGRLFGVILSVFEGLGWLIRPLTLGVRISVNLSSGHVLMLMFGVFAGGGCVVWVGVGLVLLLVVLLELLVGVLQSYIYGALLVLYTYS